MIGVPYSILGRPTIRWGSERRFVGKPLISIAFGPDASLGENYGHARGVIAIGEIACGFLAIGTVLSYGILSFGFISLGVLTFCGIGLGAVCATSCKAMLIESTFLVLADNCCNTLGSTAEPKNSGVFAILNVPALAGIADEKNTMEDKAVPCKTLNVVFKIRTTITLLHPGDVFFTQVFIFKFILISC